MDGSESYSAEARILSWSFDVFWREIIYVEAIYKWVSYLLIYINKNDLKVAQVNLYFEEKWFIQNQTARLE